MILKKITTNFLRAQETTKWFFVSGIVLRLLLEIGYTNFVHPVFEYSGFVLDVNLDKYFESWLIYIILLAIFPKTLRRTSDYLMAYLLFSFVSPLLAFYALANASRMHLYIVIFSVVVINYFRVGRLFRVPIVKHGNGIALSVITSGIFIVCAWMLYSGGLGYFNLDIERVYDFRHDVDEVINQGPMGYVNSWATKVFGPTLLAIALWRKKYILALAVFALHVFWFGVSSQKSVLFYPFLVIFLCIWFRSSKALALLSFGMSFAIFFSFIVYYLSDDITLGSLFIRRVFFIPSFLTFEYYDYFSRNGFIYWSNSITSYFIRYPYLLEPAQVIGEYLWGGSNANNSFLSTGYMHAGVLGMFFYGVLVGLLFRFIDSLANKGVPPWVAVATMIVPSQALMISADLPTALLTHGIGMAILLLILLRSVGGGNLPDRANLC